MKFLKSLVSFVLLSSVSGDLIGWNRLSGSVTRNSNVLNRINISKPMPILDQYINHFGKNSRVELQYLLRSKRIETTRWRNKKVLSILVFFEITKEIVPSSNIPNYTVQSCLISYDSAAAAAAAAVLPQRRRGRLEDVEGRDRRRRRIRSQTQTPRRNLSNGLQWRQPGGRRMP